jgi:hypothetical protein
MRQQTALSMIAAWTAMSVATAAYSGTMHTSMPGTKMSGMSTPAPAPTRQAYTGNHAFLIELRSVPHPVPFEKYFTLEFAVYDGHHPTKALPDARLTVTAGMRHGLKHGFAHGMQSTPRVQAKGNLFTVSGMYFHMAGPWTVEVDVKRDGQRGTAYFTLPCCGQ